jgi:acetyl-CoA carboxylase carboxyltransferase component
MAVGVLASDCSVNGGAIDVAAGHKSAEFLELCNTWNIPVAIFCDTPGFMVGPAHEELGAVRELAKLFGSGAALDVPSVGVVVRKCYGLGGQALLGGSTKMPDAVVAWPTGEFGAMGLEGAVQLGFKKELAACQSDEERETLFSDLLAEQYRRGAATEVATVLEIDAVIQPSQTRQWLLDCLF